MRLLLAPVALLALLLTLASSASPAAHAASPIHASFLFDLGDGTYIWADELIADPSSVNATWDAAQAGATAAGLTIQWSWYACCGVFVSDLGNRSPPSGAVALFVWNATASAWDAASVGISGLVLKDGDAVALSDNGFDPVTYAPLFPVPTPLSPYPSMEFRGDLANRGVSGSGAPDLFRVRWARDLHLREIPSSPAVAYGRVFILTMDGLFALDEASGAVIWSNLSVRGLSTPAVFNGTLLLGGSDGRLHAVDAATGTERWNRTLLAHPVFSGVTSSPKLWFDTAYVGTFNETGGPGEVVALWATNGTIRWRHSAPGSVSFSSPAISNGELFVGVIGLYNTTTQVTYDPPYGVLALDAETGAERWFHATGGSVAASPVVRGEEVLVPAKDGIVYALNATSGETLWQTNVAAGVSSPALVGSTLVVAGGSFGTGGRVAALDVTTGSPVWNFVPNGPVQSSVSAAGGNVFFSTNVANGTIYALNASTGLERWSYTPTPLQYIFGSPVVADGVVFAPSDNGRVYCFMPIQPDVRGVVNVTAPPQLELDQRGNVTIRVSAPNGSWDSARVTVEVPAHVEITGTSYGFPQTRIVVADLGRIQFGGAKWFNLTVQGNGSGLGYLNVTAKLSAGLESYAYSPVALAIVVGSNLPAPTPWLLVAAVAAAGVIAALVILVWAWRRRRGP